MKAVQKVKMLTMIPMPMLSKQRPRLCPSMWHKSDFDIFARSIDGKLGRCRPMVCWLHCTAQAAALSLHDMYQFQFLHSSNGNGNKPSAKVVFWPSTSFSVHSLYTNSSHCIQRVLTHPCWFLSPFQWKRFDPVTNSFQYCDLADPCALFKRCTCIPICIDSIVHTLSHHGKEFAHRPNVSDSNVNYPTMQCWYGRYLFSSLSFQHTMWVQRLINFPAWLISDFYLLYLIILDERLPP